MRTFNLFISHSWNYGDHYTSLASRLRQRSYFSFKDYSVPHSNPIYGARTDAQLSEAIEAKMRPCSVVLIMAGVYASYSKWIDKEIQMAKRLGKPIIAIKPHGSTRLSLAVQSAADEIVGSNVDSVVNAIRRLA
ncbi:TIR domain-containing protein [Photobacterium swingsii]|uniref:TIR domain-containing protein n=1 Tax=Photobacterium swingsii TaxID=680026 RepID=UPI004068F429